MIPGSPVRRSWFLPAALFLGAAVLECLTACNKRETLDPLAAKGRGIYISNCIACHNINPDRDGSLGPAVRNSSLELLQARVLRGEYPPGYAPKRPTKIMMKLPLMEEDVEALHAYLKGS